MDFNLDHVNAHLEAAGVKITGQPQLVETYLAPIENLATGETRWMVFHLSHTPDGKIVESVVNDGIFSSQGTPEDAMRTLGRRYNVFGI